MKLRENGGAVGGLRSAEGDLGSRRSGLHAPVLLSVFQSPDSDAMLALRRGAFWEVHGGRHRRGVAVRQRGVYGTTDSNAIKYSKYNSILLTVQSLIFFSSLW